MRPADRPYTARRLLLPLLAALPGSAALAGCGAADPRSAWTITVDTLPTGAVRVVNTPPAAGVQPSWVLEEELRIGTVDGTGPSSFGQIRGIAALEDGGVAVLDAHAKEVRIFGPDGEHRATHGRKGAGPGELESPYGLQAGADGLLRVPDHRNDRLTLFHPVRGYERSYPFRVLRYGFIWDGVVTDDGRLLQPSIALDADRSPLLRVYDPELTQIDSVPLPAPPAIDRDDPPSAFPFGSREAGRWGFYDVPWFPQRQARLDRTGQVWSTRFGDPSYRIERWQPGGDTTLVLETRRPPVAVAAAERDSAIDAIRTALQEYGTVRQDWSKIPDVKPAVESMFVDDAGRLWVRTATPDAVTTYDVYERDGRYAGTAVTRLNVHRWVAPVLRGERFWAVVTDDLDVQYVVAGRLRPVRETELASRDR